MDSELKATRITEWHDPVSHVYVYSDGRPPFCKRHGNCYCDCARFCIGLESGLYVVEPVTRPSASEPNWKERLDAFATVMSAFLLPDQEDTMDALIEFTKSQAFRIAKNTGAKEE